MRISCNWLRELVEIPAHLDVQELARLLTMAGLEIEAIESLNNESGESDILLTVNVTPNRPDALSHYGIARELSALLNVPCLFPSEISQNLSADEELKIEVRASDACQRYSCCVLDGVKVGPSPQWLQTRLAAMDIRSINNVVDITNYIMFEMGQPLHAFDYATLAQRKGKTEVVVRYAQAGEELVTLDSQSRTLKASDLVIADARGPIALAGVMGGQNTEVKAATTKILLESAYFEPAGVRRTSKTQALSTDGSYRFERGVDPNAVKQALLRAASLISEVTGARLVSLTDYYPHAIKAVEVAVSLARVLKVSGLPANAVSMHDIERILTALGLTKLREEKGETVFAVPTSRPDLTRPIDLVEEVLRIVGYDKIPEKAAAAISQPVLGVDKSEVLSKVQHTLMFAGFHEAVNLAFGSPEKITAILPYAEQCIHIKNPLGADMSVMRQSLLPKLLDNVALNSRQSINDLRLFELGAIFVPKFEHSSEHYGTEAAHQESWADERLHVAAVLSGNYGWTGTDSITLPADFYAIKGVLGQLLRQLGCSTESLIPNIEFKRNAQTLPFLHPQSAVSVKASTRSSAIIEGFVGQLHPDLMATFALTKPVFLFELNLSPVLVKGMGKKMFSPIAKFPGIERDLALVVDERVFAGELTSFIASQPMLTPYLQNIRVFDVYRGSSLPESKKSVALSLFFQDAQKTMTDELVNSLMAQLIPALAERFGAAIR